MQAIFPATAARLEEWKAQPEVLGVLLVGSKSRGHADELSDDDLEVLLTDEALARLAPAECSELRIEGEGPRRKLLFDVQYTSLTDLQRKAGSPFDLDRWPYEQAGCSSTVMELLPQPSRRQDGWIRSSGSGACCTRRSMPGPPPTGPQKHCGAAPMEQDGC